MSLVVGNETLHVRYRRTKEQTGGILNTRVTVGQFPTAAITRPDMAALMARDCLKARRDRRHWLPKLVFSSNGQGIALAGQSEDFARAMAEADIIHADGMSVVFASKLTRTPLPERVATTDFFHDAAKAAAQNGLRFFILGSTQGQNDLAVQAIRRLYPDLIIAGQHHGYFDETENEDICALIRAAKTDVLWVALGKPHQEYWCVQNRDRLRGVGWLKTCGGLLAFLTGESVRAPAWMQRVGLEWLHRTLRDPRRLAGRYLKTNLYALYRLVRYTDRTR